MMATTALARDIESIIQTADAEVSALQQQRKKKPSAQDAHAAYLHNPNSRYGLLFKQDIACVLKWLHNAVVSCAALQNLETFCEHHFGVGMQPGENPRLGVPAVVKLKSLPTHRVKISCVVDRDEPVSPKYVRAMTYEMWTLTANGMPKRYESRTVHIQQQWGDLIWAWSVLHMLHLRVVSHQQTCIDFASVAGAINITVITLRKYAGLRPPAGLHLPWHEHTEYTA